MTDPVLVEVTRGASIESRHAGAIAIVDARGKRRIAIGDVEQRVFPRSAVKSIQQLPLVETGAADRYGFGNAELALACSSHSGEPRHTATALKILAAAGRGESDLACGGHPPMDGATAADLIRTGRHWSRVHDNCSGKHSGFICLACAMEGDPKGYELASHPAQREISTALAEVTGADLGEPAIDGCSIPAYAIPLENLARGFARMATGEGLSPQRAAAARRLIDACIAEPFMMAGTGRFDTTILTMFGAQVFVKSGAEGVFCAAFPNLGLGVAIKCDDGAMRGAETVMATVIDAFLPLDEAERAALARFMRAPIANRVGDTVGEIRPVAGLAATLR